MEFDGDSVTVEAELTIKGIAKTVVLEGSLAGPAADPFGGTRISLELETVIDRREFGLDWNIPLPGGGSYLGDEVELAAALELVQDA